LGSEVRAPRLQVLADGAVLPGVIAAHVSSNNHLAADRFRVRLAAGAGGLDAVEGVGVRFDVQVGLDGGWSSLVVGEADSVGFDPLAGVLDVEGRDLSALLIDSRVDETFANRTSSEIATTLAGRHGLGVAAMATDTLVGRYYQSDHDTLTMGTHSRALSEWDLLSYLAVQEGFDLFMDGETLRFGAGVGGAGGGGTSVVLRPADCLVLRLEHAMAMERSIEVTVRSWDQRGAQAVAQTVQGGGGGRVWKHSVVRPNLPPDEAERLAGRVLADLMRHSRTISATMPGDVTLAARALVSLEGTGTGWDGGYAVSEIVRTVDVRRGFTQRVSLQRSV
jgi:phage protein D